MKIIVDHRANAIPSSDLEGTLEDELKREFTYANPDVKENPKAEPEICTARRSSIGVLNFPRGGLSRVRRILKARGVVFTVEDKRVEGCPLSATFRRELWPHQRRLVDSVLLRQNCLAEAATGSGKTSAAIAAACAAGRWTISVVRNRALLDQWVNRISEDCGIPVTDVGVVQGSTRNLRPFTVAMQQTLHSRPLSFVELSLFGFVVVDEVQMAPARTCYDVIDRFPAKYRVGISADHRRRDGYEFLTRDLFGDVVEHVGAEEAEAVGSTVPVQVAIVPTKYAPGPWYWQAMSSRNRFKIRWAQQKLVGELATDRGRIDLAVEVASSELVKGRSVAVLAERRNACVELASALAAKGHPAGLMLGGAEDKREFDDSARRVRSGELRCVVGTVLAIGTGVDVPALDAGVVTSHLSNNKQLLNQVKGRFCRGAAGKDCGRLWYLLDASVRGVKAVENVSKWFPDVVVFDDGEWVTPDEWISRHRRRTR